MVASKVFIYERKSSSPAVNQGMGWDWVLGSQEEREYVTTMCSPSKPLSSHSPKEKAEILTEEEKAEEEEDKVFPPRVRPPGGSRCWRFPPAHLSARRRHLGPLLQRVTGVHGRGHRSPHGGRGHHSIGRGYLPRGGPVPQATTVGAVSRSSVLGTVSVLRLPARVPRW